MTSVCQTSTCHSTNNCRDDLRVTNGLRELLENTYEYRTLSGHGNNIAHPTWGQAGNEHARLSPPVYADGIGQMVTTRPDPRQLSNVFCNQTHDEIEAGISNYEWLLGQFVDHTFTFTPVSPTESCNIPVPAGDPYFDPHDTGTQVIPMNRSQAAPNSGTSQQHPRQQLNLLSSYIDAASVYSVDDERLHYLRLYRDGLLKTSLCDMPPMNDGHIHNEGTTNSASRMFVCGDTRANEQVGLTCLHTIFVREHNYWARKLLEEAHALHLDIDDETLFQKAKMMVEAELQAIIYNEFLPILLGNNIVKHMPTDYDKTVNVQLWNEFVTAGFRFGHSMVNHEILRLNAHNEVIPEGNVTLKQCFFTPYLICNDGGIDCLLRGYAQSNAQRLDAKLITDLRNFLFGEPGHGGLDLAAINIQRGRDHGLPTFNDLRKKLGLPLVTTGQQITRNYHLAEEINQYYPGMQNTDLWLLLLLEDRVANSLVGQTLHRLLTEQFTRLKVGDRFWYERRLPKALVKTINHTTLGDIIKRTTGILDIPKQVCHYSDKDV